MDHMKNETLDDIIAEMGAEVARRQAQTTEEFNSELEREKDKFLAEIEEL